MKDKQMEVKKYNCENKKGSTPISQQMSNFIQYLPQYTHHYEVLPYTYNSIISMNGVIIDKQSYSAESSSHKVIYNGNTTIVILDDGSKGVSKRNPNDKYDKFTGYVIAMKRANIAKLQKEINELSTIK